MKRIIVGAAIASVLAAAPALAAEPGVLYDLGGKNDKSFNESAFRGATKYKTDTGQDFREFEIQNDSQREQALTQFANDGNDPIVAIGFSWSQALDKIAPQFPNTHFAIVDSVVDQPNVRSILFRSDEGSYLVGVLAALASKTGKVGFVGGMDIDLIHGFACGYVQGVKATNPKAEVFQAMTGTTPAAWNDPTTAGELAKADFAKGADVVYAAAGGSGLGVLQAAADEKKFSIGVDSDQNYIHPGSVLTSMVKHVDVAVYNTFKDTAGGKFTGGVQVLGVKDGGVEWAYDDNNKSLITADMKAAVDKASSDISAGTIKVHDYMTDKTCPAQ